MRMTGLFLCLFGALYALFGLTGECQGQTRMMGTPAEGPDLPQRPNLDSYRADDIASQGGVSYSGDLALSIPLLTIPGRNGHDFPIVLQYNSNISQRQFASWVGLGWSLEIGSIERSVLGRFDEGLSGGHGGGEADLPGWLAATSPSTDQADTYTLNCDGTTEALRCADKSSSSFALVPYRYRPSWGVWGNFANGCITTFNLVKEDGTIYRFGDDAVRETSGPLLFVDCGVQGGGAFFYPYRWCLNRIEYPDGAVTEIAYHIDENRVFFDDIYSTVVVDHSAVSDAAYNLFGCGSPNWPTAYTMQYPTKKLRKSRNWPDAVFTDTHYAEFIHEAPSGQVTDCNRVLTTVILRDRETNTELKRVSFTYATQSNTRNPYHAALGGQNEVSDWVGVSGQEEMLNNDQLTLIRVTTGCPDPQNPQECLWLPPYSFTYHQNPRVDWQYMTQWEPAETASFPGHYTDPVFATAWRLKDMTIPTGATIAYEFERLGEGSYRVQYDPEGRNAAGQQWLNGHTWDYKHAPACRLQTKTIEDPVGVNQTWSYTYGDCVLDPPARPIGMNFIPAYGQGTWNEEDLFLFYGGCTLGHRWAQVTNPDGSWEKSFFTSSYSGPGYDVHESYPDQITPPTPIGTYDATTVTSNSAKRGHVWKVETPGGSQVTQYTFTERGNRTDRIDYFGVNFLGNFRHKAIERSVWACVATVQTVRDGVTSEVSYGYNSSNDLVSSKTEFCPPDNRTSWYFYACDQAAYDGIWNTTMKSQLYGTRVTQGAKGGSATETHWGFLAGRWRPSEEWDLNLPNGPALKTLTYNSYDSYGNLLQTTDARGGVTKYYYGSNQTPFPSGQSAAHPYSRLTGIRRMVTWETPLERSFTYDHFGNITETTDENGNITTYEYDELGRIASIVLPGGLKKEEFSYMYANPLTASSPNIVTMVSYRGQNDATTTRVFLDGLGHEAQKQISYGNEDIVLHSRPDEMRRPKKAFKPYLANTGHGYDDVDTLTHAIAYYSGLGVSGVGAYPYSLIEYVSDGTGRVSSECPPGEAYHAGQRKRSFTYGTNTTGEFATSASALYKTTLVDENPSPYTTEQVDYTDRLGNLIASVLDPGGINAQTLFDHDAMGRVVEVTDPQGYVTEYTYDSRGLLIERHSPDGGTARYLYDDNGNLRFSQDAAQAQASKYTYRKYDLLSRLEETGEYPLSPGEEWGDLEPNDHDSPYGATAMVRHFFDNPLTAEPTARNLQGQLAAISIQSGATTEYSYYSYDDVGRVEWIAHHLDGIRPKRLCFEYDRQGNVTSEAILDIGKEDNNQYRFYEYDQVGRLSRVYTDQDPSGLTKVKQAEYQYLAGGVVKRLELGVAQGVDFKYNERDWLNQSNHESLSSSLDPGGDGANRFPVDRFGLRLGYNDVSGANGLLGTAQNALAQFNGIISWIALNTSTLTTVGPSTSADVTGWVYRYDPMNRLTSAGFFFNAGNGWNANQCFDISEMTYSANGNIATMERRGSAASLMDDLTYHYATGTNKLTRVTDAVSAGSYSGDVDSQVADNYTYDANGNAIQDLSRLMSGALYDFRNLPLEMTIDGTSVKYRYDVSGNRVFKSFGNSKNYYIRGITGETVAVYDENDDPLFWNILAGSRVIGKLLP